MKNCKYILKLRLWVEFCSDFFVVNDIYIHQLNLGPYGIFKILVDIHSKMGFFHFLYNKCIIKNWKKKTLRKRKRFFKQCIFFHFL
jgi:hypothetical protein